MRPFDFSVTYMLCELRWLPVCKRVYYKLILLTYKTPNGSVPEYLVNQLQDYCPTRVLRYVDQNLLGEFLYCSSQYRTGPLERATTRNKESQNYLLSQINDKTHLFRL